MGLFFFKLEHQRRHAGRSAHAPHGRTELAPGDTIALGPARGTLRVLEIRPGPDPDDAAVLVVELEPA